MKKLITVLVLAILLAAVTAVPASAAVYYTISDYEVAVDISESNAYDVTEVITAQFKEPRHGIYRSIPYKGTWLRDTAHGGNSNWRAKISDIRVDGYDYSTSTSDGSVVVKIGDADRYVEGTQVYRIHYRIQFFDDGLPNADEVYYNIIGTEWDTTIDRVSFSVTLPKSFDPSAVGFSTGGAGSSGYDTSALSFSVDGNTVKGTVTKQLGSYEGVALRLELPQGYFTIPSQSGADTAVLIAIAVLVLLSFLLFMLFGRDPKIVKTVEFYAPDGLTPAEVGYIIDGVVDNRDVVSLIIYWAHRGCLSIEDLGRSEFKLHKLRGLDGKVAPFENHMFDKLFSKGSVVTSADLKNTFYKTIASTKKLLDKSFQSDARRVFTKASTALRPLVSFMTALPVMATLFLTSYREMQEPASALMLSVGLGLLIMLPAALIVGTLRKWRARGRVSRVLTLLAGLVLSFGAMVVFLLLTRDTVSLAALPWCAVAATVLIGLAASFIVKRTSRGAVWLGRISGFRDFLELAERDRLVALVEQDPKYFYNILPYAWVLKVSDKWAKKFESIAIQPPDWYHGHGGMFYPVLFMSNLNRSMNSVQSSMVSSPSSSGGGGSGFSGGGFSGGGGGGGGGGSW